MASIDFDALGDKHKKFEENRNDRLMSGVPVMARLDGRSFHTLTRNCVKPYDTNFIDAMDATCVELVKLYNADVGYCQSDEITLAWISLDMFDLRIQKLCSSMAADATYTFSQEWGVKGAFDCRVWNVPNLYTAAENFMWREMDATRNSVNMSAHQIFKQKELDGVSTKKRITMMEERGFHWALIEDRLKRGSFYKKGSQMKNLTEEELCNIPEKFRPNGPVKRQVITRRCWPALTRVVNKEAIFTGDELIYETEQD